MPDLPETRPLGGTAPEDVVPGSDGYGRRPAVRLHTLKRRSEFLAARNGARWATPYFALEALKRANAASDLGPRFGFTVSKKVGGAVDRNRIKRRLRAAVGRASSARPDFDYVLIARQPALDADFDAIVTELEKALVRVNSQKPGRTRRPSPRGKAS